MEDRIRRLAVLGRAVLVLAAATAWTGGALAAGRPGEPAPAKAPGEEAAWVKRCSDAAPGDKQTCLTTQEIFDGNGKLVSSLAVETVTGRPDPRLLVAVPTSVRIPPGLHLQVDDTMARTEPYRICFFDRCFADLTVDGAFLGRMRRGETFKVAVVDGDNRVHTLSFPLAGFAAALDGPGS